MACNSKTVAIPWTTIVWDTNSTTFVPCTPWMRTTDIKSVRFVWEMRDRFGSLDVTPAMEPANTENSPGTEVGVGVLKNTNGFFYDDFQDVQTDLDGDQLVRFGFTVVGASAATIVGARVSGRVEVRDI